MLQATSGFALRAPSLLPRAVASAEILVGLLSFATVKAGRRLLRARTVGQERGARPSAQAAWQGWSEVQARQGLVETMIVCPRWNPHAIQHLVGPLRLRRRLGIDVASLRQSSRLWILSILRSGREVQTLSTGSAGLRDWLDLSLPRGSYSLALRYFQPASGARCPALRIDDEWSVEPRSVDAERHEYERFLRSLAARSGLLYRFLHSHAEVALRHQSLLSDRLVRSLYLPFGNPHTAFKFGLIAAGERLYLKVSEQVLEGSSLHVVFINRSGFPTFWHDVSSARYWSPPALAAGSYLIRAIGITRSVDESELCVDVVSGTGRPARSREYDVRQG